MRIPVNFDQLEIGTKFYDVESGSDGCFYDPDMSTRDYSFTPWTKCIDTRRLNKFHTKPWNGRKGPPDCGFVRHVLPGTTVWVEVEEGIVP